MRESAKRPCLLFRKPLRRMIACACSWWARDSERLISLAICLRVLL